MTDKFSIKKLFCVMLCLCMALSVIATGCDKEGDDAKTYTITVTGEGDKGLSGIGISIYAKDAKDDLVSFQLTDDSGKAVFAELAAKEYVAVLANVPAEYKADAEYAITSENTTIALTVAGEDATDAPTDGATATPESTDDPDATDEAENTEDPTATDDPTETADATDAPTSTGAIPTATAGATNKPADATSAPNEVVLPDTPANADGAYRLVGIEPVNGVGTYTKDGSGATLTVKKGQLMAFEIPNLPGATIVIKGNDIVVRHKDGRKYKTYTSQSGQVSFYDEADDMFTPVYFEVYNNSKADINVTVLLQYPSGSFSNPKTLTLGASTVSIEKDSEEGFNLVYTASKAGTLSITITNFTYKGSTPATCGISLTNSNSASTTTKTLEEEIEKNPDAKTVSIEVQAGETIKIVITSNTDGFTHPAATATINASFN